MINLFKSWVLSLPFIKDEIECQRKDFLDNERPKIFALAQKDLLETHQDDVEKRAEELSSEKLSLLLTRVDLTKIVRYDRTGKLIFIGGERADEATLRNLKSEAELILSTNLWRLMTETPKELAQKSMFQAGESIDDMKKGRAILYTVSTQENILNTFHLLDFSTRTGLTE